ncbi:MAG: hypothetical protein FOGNACKC_01974 [Anaerolineae bacterium]|nr:hypothetical protein [Anaerolineae bacterium]
MDLDRLQYQISQDVVAYHKRWREIPGVNSVSAALFLQQLSFRSNGYGRKAFYYFNRPCNHNLYIANIRENGRGPSWYEDLGFSDEELNTARKQVCRKIKGAEASKAFELWPETLAFYWRDADNKNWYLVNHKYLNSLLYPVYFPPPPPAPDELIPEEDEDESEVQVDTANPSTPDSESPSGHSESVNPGFVESVNPGFDSLRVSKTLVSKNGKGTLHNSGNLELEQDITRFHECSWEELDLVSIQSYLDEHMPTFDGEGNLIEPNVEDDPLFKLLMSFTCEPRSRKNATGRNLSNFKAVKKEISQDPRRLLWAMTWGRANNGQHFWGTFYRNIMNPLQYDDWLRGIWTSGNPEVDEELESLKARDKRPKNLNIPGVSKGKKNGRFTSVEAEPYSEFTEEYARRMMGEYENEDDED